MKSKQKNIRLSKHLIPERYKITLTPDIDNFTFKGEETIEIILTKPTKKITLHAVEIQIISAEVLHKKLSIKSKNINYDLEFETAVISFPKKLSKGKLKLKLVFTGVLNDKMRGFYRSKYKIDGKDYHMAVTQFESTDARRAFPCFDEPAKKAVFDVELIIPKDHTAISNTIETEVLEHSSGFKILKFAPTPKMSTYLLVFIVGRFEHIEAKTKEGILVRVFVTPGKKKQAEFALEVAVKTLSFYTEYFKIPYPMPVLDLIAIPDFASGAMENWGAVTYRETALLFDQELSSTANKQWIALVIAHELAHQWFGNLVTMQWWTHLWLNEGFASYIEYLAVDHMFPKWNIWRQFVFLDHANALELDSLKNTHPIEVDVSNPSEISEIFDAVSYSKGASIIRMLAEYLGESVFRKGLNHYLKTYSYANASTADLWKSLEIVSKKPVSRIMSNWTGKSGYPLVSVSEKEKNLKLSQSRFFASPLSKRNVSDKTLWSIPVSIISPSLKIPKKYILSKKAIEIPRSAGEWFKINAGETSFNRVLYPKAALQNLKKTIQDKRITRDEDRFGIVRDVFSIAKSGVISTTDALELTEGYKNESSYIVWAEIASDLAMVKNLIGDMPYLNKYKEYCRNIFSTISKNVGWKKRIDEPHEETLLRSVALYALGSNGDKEIIRKAQKLFENAFNKNSKLESDLRGPIYALVSENGGKKEYQMFMKLYKETPFQEEKDRILRALCRFSQKDLLLKTLVFSLSKEVRFQDSFKVISQVFGNIHGRELVWEFVKEHWETIVERFSGGHLLSRFIQGAGNLVTKKDAIDFEKFFKKHQTLGVERTISQVLEKIYLNDDWLRRDSKKIESFVENYY